jgi:outer membrane protein
LESQLNSAFQTYLTNIELVQLEEKNEAIAKQNLDITLEKFRIGTITTLEFRTAQLNYINAKVSNTNTQYQAKLSEIALKELAGKLDFLIKFVEIQIWHYDILQYQRLVYLYFSFSQSRYV